MILRAQFVGRRAWVQYVCKTKKLGAFSWGDRRVRDSLGSIDVRLDDARIRLIGNNPDPPPGAGAMGCCGWARERTFCGFHDLPPEPEPEEEAIAEPDVEVEAPPCAGARVVCVRGWLWNRIIVVQIRWAFAYEASCARIRDLLWTGVFSRPCSYHPAREASPQRTIVGDGLARLALERMRKRKRKRKCERKRKKRTKRTKSRARAPDVSSSRFV